MINIKIGNLKLTLIKIKTKSHTLQLITIIYVYI